MAYIKSVKNTTSHPSIRFAPIVSMDDLEQRLSKYDSQIPQDIKEKVSRKMARDTYNKIKTAYDKIIDRISKSPRALAFLHAEQKKNTPLHLMQHLIGSYKDKLVTPTNYKSFVGVVDSLVQVFKAKGWEQKLSLFRKAASGFVHHSLPVTGYNTIIQMKPKDGELTTFDCADIYDFLETTCDVASIVGINTNTFIVMSLEPEKLASFAKQVNNNIVTMTAPETEKEGTFIIKTVVFDNTTRIPIQESFNWAKKTHTKVLALPTGTGLYNISVDQIQEWNEKHRMME